jgi:hypothetical protein
MNAVRVANGRTVVSVRASAENPLNTAKPKIALPPALERRCKEFAERRKVLEQSRSLNVRRIQQELQRISQRELEYAQRLLNDYTPVRVSVNESVWGRWKEFLPFHVEFKDDSVVPKESIKDSVQEKATKGEESLYTVDESAENESDAPIA